MLENAGKNPNKDFYKLKILKSKKSKIWIFWIAGKCWKNAGKMLEKSKKSRFWILKCWKNPKTPFFGFFLLENAGKNPKWDFFPALVLTIFGDTFLIYIYSIIFHILSFFS